MVQVIGPRCCAIAPPRWCASTRASRRSRSPSVQSRSSRASATSCCVASGSSLILVIMADAVRIAVRLHRELRDPLFFKAVTDGKKFTYVAKLQAQGDLDAILPYLEEAYRVSLEPRKNARS